MSASRRLVAFGIVLLGVFSTAYAVGEAVPGHEHSDSAPNDAADDSAHGDGGGDDHDGMATRASGNGAGVRGLASMVDGHRIAVTEPVGGPNSLLRFAIKGTDGPVTDFTDTHGAKLHLLLIRTDLALYRHLHPVMASDGEWSVTLDLPQGGDYRMVVDVAPVSSEPFSLGLDLAIPGDSTAVELAPPDDDVVTPGGLHVQRDGFSFAISPTDGLEPYLGSAGHLVAFHEGDLAYRHLHAASNSHDGALEFHGELDAGRWRLFLQFSRYGEVVTVPFTEVVS